MRWSERLTLRRLGATVIEKPATVVDPTRALDAVFGPGATLLAVALVASGIGILGFRGFVAHHLGVADRGALDTFLTLRLVCAAPLGALFVLAARRAARLDGVLPEWRRSAIRVAGGAALVGGLTGAVLVLDGRVERMTAFVPWLVVLLAAAGAGVVPRGVLLGASRLAPVALALVVGMVLQLVLVVGFVAAGFGLGGAFAALLLGTASTTTLLWWSARPRSVGASPPPFNFGWGSLEPIIAFCALVGLGFLPAVLAHRYLGGIAGGRFASASEVARTMLFLPQAVAVVALARFARGGAGAVEALRVALRVAAATSLVAAVALAMTPELVETFVPAASAVPTGLLLMLGLAACTLGLLVVLATYHLARGLPCAGTLLAALGACLAIPVLWHPSLVALSASVVVVGLVALARLLAGPALVGPSAPWPDSRRRQAPAPSVAELELSVIVPFYNPGGEALRETVLALVDTLERERVEFEVIAVSDGSTDGSEALIAELGGGVRTVELAHNRGKGAALCAGLEVARGKYLGFIDADGDIPPDLWHSFLTLMELYNADMIVGSKRHALSDVDYPPLRRVYSRVFQALVHALFRVDVTDTQTGIKLFRREVLVDVLPLLVEDGFVFDLELLVIARRRRWRRVIEAPVRVEYQFRSTISVKSAYAMLWQTLVLAGRLYVTRGYDVPETAPTASLAISTP